MWAAGYPQTEDPFGLTEMCGVECEWIEHRVLLITVTSTWTRWNLKSPASRLFAQPFVQAQMKKKPKTSKLHVTGLCEGNSPVTGEFPAQRASNAENASIWWCHHVLWKNEPDLGISNYDAAIILSAYISLIVMIPHCSLCKVAVIYGKRYMTFIKVCWYQPFIALGKK